MKRITKKKHKPAQEPTEPFEFPDFPVEDQTDPSFPENQQGENYAQEKVTFPDIAGMSGEESCIKEGSNSKQSSAASPLSTFVQPGKCNRNDFPLDRHRAALLIIDIQEYLSKQSETENSDPTKRYLMEHALPSALENIEKLLSTFRRFRSQSNSNQSKPEIIFTYLEALTEDCRDISMDYKLTGHGLATLPTPSNPATFLPMISPQDNELRIPKTSCSVFLSTNIHYVLQNLGVEQLVLCGQITNQCVESACRDAADLGYFVTLAQDACAAYSREEHQRGLENMKGFARIVNTDQVAQELGQDHVLFPSQDFSSVERSDVGDKGISGVESVSKVVEKAGDSKEEETKSTTETSEVEEGQNQRQSEGRAYSNLVKPLIAISPTSRDCVKHDYGNDKLMVHSLLLALRAAQVSFIRYAALDCANGIRCKAVPLRRVLSNPEGFDRQVCVAESCFAGMTGLNDGILEESGLTAANVLVLKPDLST